MIAPRQPWMRRGVHFLRIGVSNDDFQKLSKNLSLIFQEIFL